MHNPSNVSSNANSKANLLCVHTASTISVRTVFKACLLLTTIVAISVFICDFYTRLKHQHSSHIAAECTVGSQHSEPFTAGREANDERKGNSKKGKTILLFK
ncbi:hypothetical protein CHARACLAT_007029 [Characodon lateralis]|uniref:Uncharacterized protein n=1 Tax=Characodon lateralis TaxID=208331 RepID=A0ABU7DGX9_9TELE|nr:hypothetical protein [Characodon lateralis]